MKINLLEDAKIDESEIESHNIWYLSRNVSNEVKVNRINLSNLIVEFSYICPNPIFIKHWTPISNGKFFGVQCDSFGDRLQCTFISDENFNITALEVPIKQSSYCHYTTCFYDGSIFTFDFDKQVKDVLKAKKYLISKNKWINLSNFPSSYVISSVGFKQKIFIAGNDPGIWVYDILVNSYSYYFPIKDLNKKEDKMLFKFSGTLYLIIRSIVNRAYFCDDPLSEWTLACQFRDQWFCSELDNKYLFRAYYKESFYYFKDSNLFKFGLKKFKTKRIGEVKNFDVGKKIQIR